MGKVLKEYTTKNERIVLLRYISGKNFKFTIERTDFENNSVSELEYIDFDSAFLAFECESLDYNFEV